MRTGAVPALPASVADLLPDAGPGAGAGAVDDAALSAFLAIHTRADRPTLLKAVINALKAELEAGGSRHDAARDATCWAMREAACGFYPAHHAAITIRDLYTTARAQDRDKGRARVGWETARAEYRSILAYAIAQVDLDDLEQRRNDVNGRTPDRDDLSWTGSNGSEPMPEPATPIPLADCVATFQKWLHLPDPSIVTATLGAVAANLIPGDPLWLLIVGPPSSAKTECLSALIPLPYVYPAAKVTEAALLSGTPVRERAKAAKGGLLRLIGDFGIMLIKDFTSVLAQNRDARNEAVAALREVFDGRWDRPIGGSGGLTLTWIGKCGLVGGCTPTIDRHHLVMGTLGERFLFFRVAVDGPGDQATRRLTSRRHEPDMRRELVAAAGGVLAGVDRDADFPPDPDEDRWLVSLAVWTARARTPVERDGYDREVVVMPESEGPARIVTQLGAMRDGLIAIGATEPERWAILHKLAWDAMPTMRREVLEALRHHDGWATRADLMAATDIPRTPIERELEDLVLIGLADREKDGTADNSPWKYRLSSEAHDLWPQAAPKCKGGAIPGAEPPTTREKSTGSSTSRGSSALSKHTEAFEQLKRELGPLHDASPATTPGP